MQHARDRIRELTVRSRLLLPVETVVEDINMFLRGWAAYFRYGHSTIRFDKIRQLRAGTAGDLHREAAQTRPTLRLDVVAYLSPEPVRPDQP